MVIVINDFLCFLSKFFSSFSQFNFVFKYVKNISFSVLNQGTSIFLQATQYGKDLSNITLHLAALWMKTKNFLEVHKIITLHFLIKSIITESYPILSTQ